jgi:hypothetical protein
MVHAADRYAKLMALVKARLVKSRELLDGTHNLFALEQVALHLRKIIEAVAHASLISCEMRTGHVPRQVRDHHSASYILAYLSKRDLLQLPRHALIREQASEGAHTIDVHRGSPDLLPWLLEIYEQCDAHLHELRPYLQWDYFSGEAAEKFKVHWEGARQHHKEVWNWLWNHAVELEGKLYVARMGQQDMSQITVVETGAVLVKSAPQPLS